MSEPEADEHTRASRFFEVLADFDNPKLDWALAHVIQQCNGGMRLRLTDSAWQEFIERLARLGIEVREH